MINDTNKNEMIEQYLRGELSGDLLKEFTHRLSTDSNFKKEVSLERAIVKNLQTVGRKQWQHKLESFHQELDTELPVENNDIRVPGKTRKLTSKQYVFAAAASIVLIIACTLLINSLFQSTSTPDEIFAAEYKPYPSIEVKRSASGEADLKNNAFAAYNEGNYLLSIELFQQILAEQNDESTLFYLGNAYLSANQPKQAIAIFNTYLKEYDEFTIEARWYLALSYIKDGQVRQAQQQLEALAADGSPANSYKSRANAILKQLE